MDSKVAKIDPARHQRRADGIVDPLFVHVLGSAPFASIGHSVSTSDLVPRKPPANVPENVWCVCVPHLSPFRTKGTGVIVIDPGFPDARLTILADGCDVLLSTVFRSGWAEPEPGTSCTRHTPAFLAEAQILLLPLLPPPPLLQYE
ncbi:hypothetical protein F4774DRAFT_405400 [Daldinia eschscholtzii]|nr:hypothetical protein F4774DRAFT_405400 [Daldinia eschscholtzii]